MCVLQSMKNKEKVIDMLIERVINVKIEIPQVQKAQFTKLKLQ